MYILGSLHHPPPFEGESGCFYRILDDYNVIIVIMMSHDVICGSHDPHMMCIAGFPTININMALKIKRNQQWAFSSIVTII